MGKWLGTICVILGVACLLGAVGFLLYNRWEAENAQQTSRAMLENVQQVICGDVTRPQQAESLPKTGEMTTVQVEGYDCIGILSLPALELELPVLADWSYTKLKKAPCLYYGSCYEADFVIAAHNYDSHFGRLSQLQAGDVVTFTDINGEVFYYEVALLETLPKEATLEMIASGFALSLYTCTPGGGSRVTVRCNRK